MLNVFFRVDASNFIGYGHLYRTFVLAKEFQKNGFQVNYITRIFDDHVKKFIENENFVIHPILEDYNIKKNWTIKKIGINDILKRDLEKTQKIADKSILICDNYSLSSDYYNQICQKVAKLIAFDDINDRYYHVDILINQNYGSEKYFFQTANNTNILAGIKYTLQVSNSELPQ